MSLMLEYLLKQGIYFGSQRENNLFSCSKSGCMRTLFGIQEYGIRAELNEKITGKFQSIVVCPLNHVGIYENFLEVGLHFPISQFLTKLFRFYHIHISQLFPNAFRRVLYFLCKADHHVVPVLAFSVIFIICPNSCTYSLFLLSVSGQIATRFKSYI